MGLSHQTQAMRQRVAVDRDEHRDGVFTPLTKTVRFISTRLWSESDSSWCHHRSRRQVPKNQNLHRHYRQFHHGRQYLQHHNSRRYLELKANVHMTSKSVQHCNNWDFMKLQKLLAVCKVMPYIYSVCHMKYKQIEQGSIWRASRGKIRSVIKVTDKLLSANCSAIVGDQTYQVLENIMNEHAIMKYLAKQKDCTSHIVKIKQFIQTFVYIHSDLFVNHSVLSITV